MSNFGANIPTLPNKQFRLSRQHAIDVTHNGCRTIDDWRLEHEASLPVIDLYLGDEPAGWLLGWAISRGDIIDGRQNVAEEVEQWIASLSGRFLVVLPSIGRIYPDAAGSLSLVFKEGVAASTTTLIDSDEDADLAAIMGVPPKLRDWFPFGLTARRGVERLIPNHYLDLHSWRLVRCGPRSLLKISEPRAAIAELSDILQSNIAASRKHYPLLMSLTAGRDSRILLAHTRDVAHEVLFFTRQIDAKAALDAEVANEISARFNLNHRILPYLQPTDAELLDWQYLTGFAVSGRWWQSIRSIASLPHDRMFLPGLGLEVGRAFYWRPGDTASMRLSGALIIDRLRMPHHPMLLDRANKWLSDLPSENAFHTLDLLYIEQRLGCWAPKFDTSSAP